MIQKLVVLLCIIPLMNGCEDNSTNDTDASHGFISGGSLVDFIDPVISYCHVEASAGQSETRGIVGLWQFCEGPREQNGCSLLDDDGFIFRSDGTFAFSESAQGGDLKPGGQVCTLTNNINGLQNSLHGRYLWTGERLTLVADDPKLLYSLGFCEASFKVIGDEAELTLQPGQPMPLVRLEESRLCGECGEFISADGNRQRTCN